MSRRSSEANARKRRNGLTGVSGEWKGFVDLNLSDADKEHLQSWVVSDEWDGYGAIAELVERGYKLSLSPDPAHNCVVATVTGRVEGNENLGYSMSARGPSVDGAVAALAYKVLVVLQGGAWEDNPATQDRQLSLWG